MHSWLARDGDDESIGFDQLAARQRDAQARYRIACHAAVDKLMDGFDSRDRARIASFDGPLPRDSDVTAIMKARRAQAHADLDARYNAAVADAELHLETIRRRLGDEPVH